MIIHIFGLIIWIEFNYIILNFKCILYSSLYMFCCDKRVFWWGNIFFLFLSICYLLFPRKILYSSTSIIMLKLISSHFCCCWFFKHERHYVMSVHVQNKNVKIFTLFLDYCIIVFLMLFLFSFACVTKGVL